MQDTTNSAVGAPEAKKSKDLVTRVHDLLIAKRSPLAEKFPALSYIKKAEGLSDDEQRRLINKQFRMELGSMDRNTSVARLTLDDTCSISDYMKNFKQHALPLLAG